MELHESLKKLRFSSLSSYKVTTIDIPQEYLEKFKKIVKSIFGFSIWKILEIIPHNIVHRYNYLRLKYRIKPKNIYVTSVKEIIE